MNLSCGSRTIKYLIFTFNFFLVITGIVLISVGASIRTIYSDYHLFLSGNYFSLPNLLIATGCLIFCISFLGCYGAMKQSWIMLMGFSILLGLIFIFEFAAGIAGYVLRDQTSNYLENTMRENMKFYGADSSITELWDTIQKEFQCCGVINYNDWLVDHKHDLPISCCPAKSGIKGGFYCNNVSTAVITSTSASTTATSSTGPSIAATSSTGPSIAASSIMALAHPEHSQKKRDVQTGSSTSDRIKGTAGTTTETTTETTPAPSTTTPETTPASSTTTPYGIGCQAAFGDFVKANAVDIGGIGIALAVIQLIGIGFSCYLSHQLKNSYYST